ncbi:hypothetical protein FGO68_gene11297 [Halteria grandinella]|uniref:O-acyltransferase n=1 Tax=Halteria grandinella TaxID=5974 RepID=A0A8J8NQT3_HALGN|nr:hypothetical protein FGO68_gene11297 [Halteria grandinella]
MEVLLFVAVLLTIRSNPEWPLTHHIFLGIQTQVIFCKSHSYFVTNNEMRSNKQAVLKESAKEQKDKSTDTTKIEYPANITLSDWLLFFFSPTLVYELNFPRRKHFRPIYFLCHALMFIANMFIQYMVVTEDIMPIITSNTHAPFIELYLQLQMPLILMIMLMVFLLFESFPNALSELTLFADREFYQDWWNATSVEEFYGKWLKPSYLFYYRHVLIVLQREYGVSPSKARAITNLVSSAMQELIMIMSFQVYGLHLFKAQLVATLWSFIQFKYQPFNKETMNAIVLTGFLVGAPLLLTLYIRDFTQAYY